MPLTVAAARVDVPLAVLEAAAAAGDLATMAAGREIEGEVLVPAWQLDSAAPTGVLAGVARLQVLFAGDTVALSRWMTRPCVDFDGRAPCEALRAGEVDDVLLVAENLTAAGW